MALVGNIRDFGLSDFLYLVDRGYKTGGLHLNYGGEYALLFFEKGKLVYAARTSADQTGDVLVRLGLLSSDQLAKARAMQDDSDQASLTHVLIDHNIVTAGDLQKTLQTHIEESVYSLFGWPEGEFRFEQGQKPGTDLPVMPVAVPVENLIMEGVRRIDEWGRIKDRIPDTNMVVKFVDQPGEKAKGVKLAPEEWRVFARINGKDTLEEIAQKTNLSDFDVCRVVYGFVTAGLVQVSRKPRPAQVASAARGGEPPRVKKSLVNRIINRIRGM